MAGSHFRKLDHAHFQNQPPGALASIPDALRYGSVVVGFLVFLLAKRSIFAGVACGEIVMVAGKWWAG